MAFFVSKTNLDRIELDLRSIERDVRSIDGRMCHLEGMARVALWGVPLLLTAITALGTAATVLLSHH